MGKLILREIVDTEIQDLERAKRFNSLDATSKMRELFALIDLSVNLNGGKPLKIPQGKGLILRKIHINSK
jgi:hypothetical protein